MSNINRRKFFCNMLALSAVTSVKPSSVTHVTAPTGFVAMSGTSMATPEMSSRIAMLVQLSRQIGKTETIDALQRRIGTESKIENHQWRPDGG